MSLSNAELSINSLANIFNDFGIEFDTSSIQHHAAVVSSESQLAVLGGAEALKGVMLKNLVVKDKKKRIYLITFEYTRQIDMKSLAKSIPGAGAFRFLGEEDLLSILGTAKGSVSPLAVVNDEANKVIVIISKTARQASALLVHPLSNEATMMISPDALEAFVCAAGNTFEVIDFDAKPQDEKKEKSGKGLEAKKKEKFTQVENKDTKGLTIRKTAETFGPWFSQVCLLSEMIDYYDISGCYILRPWSYFIWEQIQSFLDKELKKMGIKNCYFPMFVSNKALEKEKDHVEGFAPEVAWVTRAGDSELDESIAIRPTSETVMYPLVSKWVRSHRDLPLRLNQWCNVVRWEFKCPTPFIRSREFLWQEGHSAFASQNEAEREVRDILDLYTRVYEELLACPIISGKKTEKEKFAGGLYTTTAEAFIPTNGRGVQGATSHCLGQKFAEMFKINFEDDQGKKHLVWQNSWGMTTRTIGVMTMIHADDKGQVLPPRIAPIQVIIVPIYFKNQNHLLDVAADEIIDTLFNVHVRVEADKRTIYNPGWKFNHWELKGVSLRLEVGPKDLKNNSVVLVRRDTGEKITISRDALSTAVPSLLETMQSEMFSRAKAQSDAQLSHCTDWNNFIVELNNRKRVMIPFCLSKSCEEKIGKLSAEQSKAVEEKDDESAEFAPLTGAAKSLCIPFEQAALSAGTQCIMHGCLSVAQCWTMFGRSY